MDLRMVLVTFPSSEAAEAVANEVVENGLAACVNIFKDVTSVYTWEGQLNKASEALAIIKTSTIKIRELQSFIETHHSYSVPEFVVIAPEHVAEAYAAWVVKSTV